MFDVVCAVNKDRTVPNVSVMKPSVLGRVVQLMIANVSKWLELASEPRTLVPARRRAARTRRVPSLRKAEQRSTR